MSQGQPKYLLLSSLQNYKPSTAKSASMHTLAKPRPARRLPSEQSPTSYPFPQLEQQLRQVMGSLHAQRKRQHLLSQLNSRISEETNNMHKREEKQKQQESQNNHKMVAKLEYDIEQINNKRNEERAVIGQLKESIAAGRAERVVFSKLFQSIEREITRYQHMYQDLILKSELLPLQVQQHTSPSHATPTESKASSERDDKREWEELSDSHYCPKTFLTCLDKKPLLKTRGSGRMKRSIHIEQQIIEEKIEEVIAQTMKAVMIAECDSLEQAIEHYEGLQANNEQIMGQIAEKDEKIYRLEKKIEETKRQKKKSETYEERRTSKLEKLNSRRHIRAPTVTALPPPQQDPHSQNMQLLEQISEVLEMQEPVSLHNDYLSCLDGRIEELIGDPEPKASVRTHTRAASQLNMGSPEGLINRMEGFDFCQRIMTREQLHKQYRKELSKSRKQLTKVKK